MRARERKAWRAWLSRPIVKIGLDRYAINPRRKRDGSIEEPYVMYKDGEIWRCGCEGFKKASACKHLDALQRHLTKGPPKAYRHIDEDDLTYPQDWPRYNLSTAIMDRAVRGLLRSLGGEMFPIVLKRRDAGRPAYERSDLFLAIALRAYEQASGRAAEGLISDLFQAGFFDSKFIGRAPSTSLITTWMREEDMFDAFCKALRVIGEAVAERESIFSIDSKEYNTPHVLKSDKANGGKADGDKTDGDKVDDNSLPDELRRTTVKGHCLVGTATKICVAASVTHGKSGDSLQLEPLVRSILRWPFRIRALAADKAYTSGPHLRFLDDHGIYPAMPAKIGHERSEDSRLVEHAKHWSNRTEEQKDIYGMRQIAESYNAMTVRNTTEDLRSRTFAAQKTELMSMFVVVNCMRLVHLYIEDKSFDIPFMDEQTRALLDDARDKVAHLPKRSKEPKPQRKSNDGSEEAA